MTSAPSTFRASFSKKQASEAYQLIRAVNATVWRPIPAEGPSPVVRYPLRVPNYRRFGSPLLIS